MKSKKKKVASKPAIKKKKVKAKPAPEPRKLPFTEVPVKKKIPRGLTPWKKGQSGNPEGGRAHDPLVRKVRHLTKQQLAEMGNLVLQNNVVELKRTLKDTRHSSTLKVMLASIMHRVINKGDSAAFDVLLNRLIGKVTDKLELNDKSDRPLISVTLPSNGREAKKK